MTTQTPEPTKKSYKTTLNLPQTAFPMEAKLVQNEPKRLEQWQAMHLYERIQINRSGAGKGKWVLHDGPPFANGDIHIGHLINKTLKDVILRFRTLQGYQTPYVPGWDCHGLPIEHKIQEEIKKEKLDFRSLDTVEIRRRCLEYAQKYVELQCEQFKRLGILGDWKHPYLTMSPGYEASTLEVFATFVEAGLVYRKLKPVPWSIANQTALADAELEYQDVQDQSVYVEFEVITPSPGTPGEGRGEGDFESADPIRTRNHPHQNPLPGYRERGPEKTYLLIWTTTPWTLPANLAIAAGPDVVYARVSSEGRTVILAADLVERVFRMVDKPYQILSRVTGSELIGVEYRHPFLDRVGRVVAADYVTTTDGTGLVHTAPGHGEDDYETGLREKLDVYSPVLANGRYDDTAPEWLRSKTVWEGNKLVIEQLKKDRLLFAEETITHSYPHDWRSKTPIIFRATEQWFVAMDKPFSVKGESGEPKSLRARAQAAANGGVEFVPKWGQARLEGMLQSRPDWCISRQRAWGLPIPVFYNEQGEPLLTPQSVRAVATYFGEHGSDAWFTEPPTELLACDQTACPAHFGDVAKLRKERDIFDVWFESGSSWHAVLQARSSLHFPADLYLEGSDQHRGWFQLSMLPSLAVTGQAPFKQVLTHGFVVKPDGTKVSKSDKEYVKAVDEINRHGADVLRLWCCSVDYQNDIPASPKALQEFGDKYRKIRNTLRYLLSNLYDFNGRTQSVDVPANSLDAWALAELDDLIRETTVAYDTYQLHRAFRLLHEFCAVQISAIYGNAMKDRLYCETPDSPLRRRCQTVMYRMVLALTKLLSPMLVFTADETWEFIPHKPVGENELPSVHLALLPEPSAGRAEGGLHDWGLLMQLRETALLQLDGLKKAVGLNKASEAEARYTVPDADTRDRLAAFGVDLEDVIGVGFHTIEIVPGSATAVEVIDARGKYPACARSWKRRPDVGSDPAYPDLCARDAAAMRTLSNT